jgi:MSHA biogenesis protein MshQ
MTTASIVDIDIIDDTGNTEASGTALAGDDPPLDFRDTGFRFYADGVANSIGTQIAGKESNIAPDSQLLTLRAVQTNTDTMACEARLTGPQTIDMAFECITPTTCQTNNGVQISGIAIADNPLGGVASYIPVTLDFGATGTAAFTLNYADVGQISLHAEKDIAALAPDPPITLTGSSNPFTVRPFALLVTATGNPGTVDANGAIFTKAGADFSATVTAVAWQAVDDLDNNGMADGHDDGDPTTHADLSDNTVTPNFGREASPEAVTLTALLDQPVGGHDPGLAGATQLTAFANGAATTLVRYDEVGIIELAAAVDDGDYLAIGPAATAAITGKSGYVGRFPPHNFLVTISPAPPLFTDACVAGNYSYLGETFPFATPPTITITAVSGAPTPTITQNYDCGGFWKFTTPLDLAYSYTDSSGHGLALTPAAGTVNPLMADTTDCTGFVQLTLLDTLSYARPATTSPLAPFAASVDLTVNQDQFRDSDLVCFDTGGGCQGFSQTAITGTTLRHGLVQVFNSFGPETMDITNSPFAAQYYDGTSWVTNSEDDCSTALLFCSTPVADRVPPLSIQPDPLSGGQGTLTVTTAGISGETVDVCLTAPAWLSETDCTAPGPTCGTFTFGIYRGNDRIINWREVIQ